MFSQIVYTLVSRVFFELINPNASWATAGSCSLFATWLFPFSNTVATGTRVFFEGGVGEGGRSAMKLRLPILAESGPEKSIWLSRFGACEFHKAHYFKTNRIQEAIMGSCRYKCKHETSPMEQLLFAGIFLILLLSASVGYVVFTEGARQHATERGGARVFSKFLPLP